LRQLARQRWISSPTWHCSAGWAPRVPSEHVRHTCARPLLEARLRRRVLALPRVRFLEGAEVTGLLADSVSNVRGVRVRRHGPGAETQSLEHLPVDLVVDASGRASQAPRWLAELAIGVIQETVINAFLGYASRLMLPSLGFSESWRRCTSSARRHSIRVAV
jgi:2-polyprenyl-6-methoxyphenol hydroxylase-like FAD-dependent oxidoreductase